MNPNGTLMLPNYHYQTAYRYALSVVRNYSHIGMALTVSVVMSAGRRLSYTGHYRNIYGDTDER